MQYLSSVIRDIWIKTVAFFFLIVFDQSFVCFTILTVMQNWNKMDKYR